MPQNDYLDSKSWEEYQQSFSPMVSTELDFWDKHRVKMIKFLVGTGKTVIDLGSGCGSIAEEIRKQGNDVWVLDSEKAVKLAKELHPELKILAGSALNIPTDEKFDCVLVSELIEHIIDIEKLFLEIKRIMKDDGILIITTPNCSRLRNVVELLKGVFTRGFDYTYESPIHIRFFTPYTFTKLINNYFKIDCIAGATTPAGKIDWEGISEEEKKVIQEVYERFRKNYPIDIDDEKTKFNILNTDLTVLRCKK